MGFAIRRPDGSYRCWNRSTQDDVLRVGEVWEEAAVSPTITPDPLTQAQLDALRDAEIETDKKLETVVRLLVQQINVVRAALVPPLSALTRDQVITSLKTIYRSL
jgi:hypothetical protein